MNIKVAAFTVSEKSSNVYIYKLILTGREIGPLFEWSEYVNEVSYCRFGNFCENLIFANSIKRHISDMKNSILRQDLPISIND